MSLDVHSYDRHLDISLIQFVNNFNIITSDDIYSNFLHIIINKTGSNHPAFQGLQLIVNNSGQNIDNINNLDAKHMLNIVLQYYNNCNDEDMRNTIIEVIIEQMSDMFLTGQCPQGRTIRLYQILQFLNSS